MNRPSVFLIIAILLASSVCAFTWDTYTGTTQWNVHVVDDESGCGGGPVTKDIFTIMTHDKFKASMNNFGHGATSGTFDLNTLTILGRTIDDSGGKSDLHEANIVFSDDCKSFQGDYTWYYYSTYQKCTGTTTLTGKRADNQGCPEASIGTMVSSARTMTNEKDKEAKLKEILAKDPTNFWANYDLAELKKSQKNYPEYLKSLEKALENEKINDDARKALREGAQKRLGLTTYPTKETSPILGTIVDQTNNFQGGWMFELKTPEVKPPKSWPIMLIDSWTKKFSDAVDTLVQK